MIFANAQIRYLYGVPINPKTTSIFCFNAKHWMRVFRPKKQSWWTAIAGSKRFTCAGTRIWCNSMLDCWKRLWFAIVLPIAVETLTWRWRMENGMTNRACFCNHLALRMVIFCRYSLPNVMSQNRARYSRILWFKKSSFITFWILPIHLAKSVSEFLEILVGSHRMKWNKMKWYSLECKQNNFDILKRVAVFRFSSNIKFHGF